MSIPFLAVLQCVFVFLQANCSDTGVEEEAKKAANLIIIIIISGGGLLLFIDVNKLLLSTSAPEHLKNELHKC